jgi:hypothetical protein
LGQEKDSDPEAYKLRVEGQFWYSSPTATISGSSAQVPISFDKTFGFTDYSTFNANVDWHFKRKHHLFFAVSPNQITRTRVLQQTITFKDKTFLAGSSATGEMKNYAFAPGYRYDIIHRASGHLGILFQINLLDIWTLTRPLRGPSSSPARLLWEVRQGRSSCHCQSVVPMFDTISSTNACLSMEM